MGGWRQLSDRGTRDHKLQAGFSGCPLLDPSGHVVGIFAQADLESDVSVGVEIPVSVAMAELRAADPDLDVPVVTPGRPEAVKAHHDLTLQIQYYLAKLESWPDGSVDGQELVEPLRETLRKVEDDVDYCRRNRQSWAVLYRMIGGAYLIHSGMEMDEKLAAALPLLRQSRQLWPEQQNLKEDISFLEALLRDSSGSVREYLTAVLRILRGPADAGIPELVCKLAASVTGPEGRAESWLMHDATSPPIMTFLQGLQLMIKNERDFDVAISVSSRLLPDGAVEVRALVGPMIFCGTSIWNARSSSP